MANILKLSGVAPADFGDVSGIAKGDISNINGYTLPSQNLLLDDYSGSAAGYSVRKLRSAYSGSAMRVRRTAAPFDEQDIGFDSNGDLDTSAIATFGGSDSLTVSVWYDQSGGSNNATQTTASYQFEIYDGSSVITENGKPILRGTLAYFPSVISTSNELWSFAVATNDSHQFSVLFWDISGSRSWNQSADTRTALSYANIGTPSSFKNGSAITALTQDDMYGYLEDQVLLTTGFNQSLTDLGFGLSYVWNCPSVQEIVLFSGAQSSNRAGIEANIMNYFSIT